MIDADTMEKFEKQGEMLANRVKKKYKHLHKRFARQNIEVFRLYDWDIPEIRAVVDWYAGHVVLGEYWRKQSVPEWLPVMGNAVGDAMNVPREKVHLKQRLAGVQNGKRYDRIDHTDEKFVVSERDLKFLINPSDYIDTGLFSDHRNTRQMVREQVSGKNFLNLYCYTGAFSCYAALGGAERTLSVDRSETAVKWARENFKLNKIPLENNRLVQSDVLFFLKKVVKTGERFDLAVVDPPSFSNTRVRRHSFDILEDHPDLLAAVIQVMQPGGVIIFSTNHQGFDLKIASLETRDITEITDQTIPEDYVRKRRPIHRCWRIRV